MSAVVTIMNTNYVHLMDLRETDILDNIVDTEEDVGSGRRMKEQFEVVNDGTEATSSDESEEDPEFRELEERSQIVEKYEKGPEQEVEEWENPDLELYKVTDRYGFMHKDIQEISVQELEEKKRMIKEVSREQKWLQMISRWNQGKSTNDKFRKRLWKGVPEKFRSLVWARLLGISRYRQEQKSNVYQELLMRARLISKDIKQIDLDINRTYRDHLAFRRRYDVKQQSLFNVLAAYAMYNTEVGYCQGMSQIAALFLMYMNEEDAFWCLHSLLVNKKHSMHGFFVPGFPKLVRFQTHYEKILQKYLPRLKKHLDKSGIPPIYVTKWWFGCYLDRVPFPLALRLWDVFLLEGDVILIAMAYNIMKMHEKTMRKLQMENFMEYIQTVMAQDFGFSDEETMKSLQDCLKKLHNDRMLLPAPPKADDAPETPMKPFGPVLSRSMIDIRLDIAEIQSRSSRANSVAGKSPVGIRRQRLPPSPTPLAKYKLSQLPPRRMKPAMPEYFHSSTSSTSTVKDTSSREQQQTTKFPTDTTNSINSPMFRPESRESYSKMYQQQRTPVLAKRIDVKNTWPLTAEEVQHGMRMSGRNPLPFHVSSLSHANNEEELERRRQELQPQQQQQQSQLNKRPTILSIKKPMLQLNFSSSSIAATKQGLTLEEPIIDYDNASFCVQPSRSSRFMHPIASTVVSSAPVTPSFLRSPNNFISLRRNEIAPGSYASGLQESNQARSKFRRQSDNDEISQQALRHTHRDSYYDNVPLNSSNLNELSQSKLISDQESTTTSEVHTANTSLDRRFKPISNIAALQNKQEQRISEIETRVVQLPNNVTYVRVEDAADNMPSSSQQRQYYNVKKEVHDTLTAVDRSDISSMDLQFHQRRHNLCNSMGTHSRYDQTHFPKPNQLEGSSTHYNTNKQSLERYPVHIPSERCRHCTGND